MTRHIQHIVGKNAHQIRTDEGATLEDVAKVARTYGLTAWGGSRVSDLEHGRVSPTVSTIVALALTLGEIRQSPLTLAELFAYNGTVEVNGLLAIQGPELVSFLAGHTLRAESARGVEYHDEAERRLSRRLDLPPDAVSAASLRMYGRSASDERDRRAGIKASAQKRGRVMRAIQDELKAAL